MTDNQTCQRCLALKAENRKLKLELKRLRHKLKELKALIKWALQQLHLLYSFLVMMRKWAEKLLKQKSGVPRDKWHFAQGVYWLAYRAGGWLASIILRIEAALAALGV